MLTEEPSVSVVLITYNRLPDIEAHLPSIVASATTTSWPCEVIVVDNASTDGTGDFVATRFPTVRIVREEVPGSASARNAGIRASRGEYIVFTDDDVETPDEWVDCLVGPIASGDADVTVGGIKAHPTRIRSWMTERVLTELAHVPEPKPEVPEVVGASFAARRDVAQQIGFDETLARPPYQRSDDTFFGLRAQEQGLRVRGVTGAPALHYYHLGRLEKPAMERLVRNGGRARAYMWHHWLHADPPHLMIKSIVFRLQYWTALPWLRRHPSDRDFEVLSKIAFVDEMRRLRDTVRNYPSPSERISSRL